MNIFTIGELVKIPDYILKAKFGKVGLDLKQKLLGNDNDEVAKCDFNRIVKSVGNGTTTIKDIKTREQTHSVINALCVEISRRLRDKGFFAKGISISIKTSDFECFHHSNNISFSTNSSNDLYKMAIMLLETFWKYDKPVRAIRICTFNLEDAHVHQINMFENIFAKDKLNKAIDKIRARYGYCAIMPASMFNNNLIDTDRVSF